MSAHEALAVASVGAVILTSGFRPDYRSWVQLPVFDDLGFPIVEDDLSDRSSGSLLLWRALPAQRSSSLLFGVGQDAALVAATVAAGLE